MLKGWKKPKFRNPLTLNLTRDSCGVFRFLFQKIITDSALINTSRSQTQCWLTQQRSETPRRLTWYGDTGWHFWQIQFFCVCGLRLFSFLCIQWIQNLLPQHKVRIHNICIIVYLGDFHHPWISCIFWFRCRCTLNSTLYTVQYWDSSPLPFLQ